jgi:hypothetical protein
MPSDAQKGRTSVTLALILTELLLEPDGHFVNSNFANSTNNETEI